MTLAEISNYGCCTNVAIDDIPNDAWILELEDLEKDSARILQRLTKSERQIKGVRHSFKKGNVLYSKLRTYLNKVLVADKDGSCTTEIIPFSLYGGICAKYISFVLRSKYFVDYAIQCGYGVKMPRLSTTDAHNGLIPLPPLKEQLRIVRAIEEYICTIDMIDNDKVELLSLSSNLKNKILQFAISGKLVPQDPADEPAEELLRRINPSAVPADKSHYRQLPNGWCCCRLGDLMDFQSSLSYTKHDIMPTGIRIIRGGNVKDGRILLMEDDVFISTSLQNEASEIKKGDIIMVASTGSETLIGKTGFADGNYPNSYIGAFLRIIRPKTNVMPQFINLVMNSAQFKKHIRKEAKGSNINNVKKSTVIDFIVPLPPYNEQCRIVEAIESINRRIDDIAEVL